MLATQAGQEALGLDAQAYGTRIAALIDSLGDNAAVFGLKDPKDLEELQGALRDALDGKPGAIEDVKLAISSIGPLLPEGSKAATAFKGLGFVVGVAGPWSVVRWL